MTDNKAESFSILASYQTWPHHVQWVASNLISYIAYVRHKVAESHDQLAWYENTEQWLQSNFVIIYDISTDIQQNIIHVTELIIMQN